MNARSTKVGLG